MPLAFTAAKSATDAAIHRKMFGSWATKLITSNEEINDITSLKESSILIKVISRAIKTEVKEQKGGFSRMLLDI